MPIEQDDLLGNTLLVITGGRLAGDAFKPYFDKKNGDKKFDDVFSTVPPKDAAILMREFVYYRLSIAYKALVILFENVKLKDKILRSFVDREQDLFEETSDKVAPFLMEDTMERFRAYYVLKNTNDFAEVLAIMSNFAGIKMPRYTRDMENLFNNYKEQQYELLGVAAMRAEMAQNNGFKKNKIRRTDYGSSLKWVVISGFASVFIYAIFFAR